jgi:hypothetical protein
MLMVLKYVAEQNTGMYYFISKKLLILYYNEVQYLGITLFCIYLLNLKIIL